MSIAGRIVRIPPIVIFVQLTNNVTKVAAFNRSFSIQHRYTGDAPLFVLFSICTKNLSNTICATYRILPKSTLCFGKSVKVFDLFTDAALQLSDLLWCAGNARNPPFDGGISNLAGRYAVLKLELLNCREEVDGLGLTANSAFDSEVVSWNLAQ